MSSSRTLDRPPGTSPPRRPAPRRRGRTGGRTWRRALRRDWQLYSLAVLPLLFFVVFRYLPMAGNVIAFRRYAPGGSLFGGEWVGLHYFRLALEYPTFRRVFLNTLIIGVL